MDYFPKTEMSQLMSGTTSETLTNYTPDLYSTYADSFDLSLLSANDRDTLSILTGSTVSETIKNQSPIPSPIDPISTGDDTLDFIPKTIFNNNNDQLMTLHNNNSNNNNNNTNQSSNNINSTLSSDNLTPSTIIKTEKLWNCDTTIQLQNNKNSSTIIDNNNYNINSPISNSTTLQQFGQDNQNCNTSVAAASLLFQQLQKQYQFYPSPLPSPPQYEFCNLNSVSSSINYSLYSPASSTLSPSPCPSLDQQQINTNNINFGGSTNSLNNPIQNFIPQVKQEYLILPPSPPESNGSPSPSLNQEIKSEPGDNEIETNLIEINILLEKTLQNLEEENQKNQKKEEQKLQNNQINQIQQQQQQQNIISSAPAQDHQLLREYLQDTSFQKKHNLKPLALESLIGGLGVRGDIEPVISLALEHAKRDAQATCAQLQISPDPQQWTTTQVHAWLRSTIEQFKLQQINELELKFPEDGINLLCLTEEEFIRRVPESGATIHAQLEIWKLACCDNFLNDIFPAGPSTSSNLNNNNNNDTWPTKECDMDFTDDEDDDMDHQQSITTLDTLNSNENGQRTLITNLSTSTDYNTLGNLSQTTVTQSNNNITNAGNVTITQASTTTTTSSTATTTTTNATTVSTNSSTNNTPTTKTPRTGGSHIHLWQFLKELLASPQVHGTAIRWLDRNKGVFKIEDSVRVAKLWGRRKNRPAMNYDKLSRSIRQYYKKGIMKKTERSQRLVYQFCPPYSG